ncbi:peroxidase-like [Haliotis cracherodii]|uniref:peroxidase-like n=1 Tax=Haliotis cracherodii TaxID=6455 RepID=UPI0039EC52FD
MAFPSVIYILAALCLCVAVADYYDDFIDTPSDQFGNIIGHDRMSEIAAMRSTKLGYGLGGQFQKMNDLFKSPFGFGGLNFGHKIFKRQAPGFGPVPSFTEKASFGPDPFHNDPFQNSFGSTNDKTNFFKDSDSGFKPQKEVKISCSDRSIQCDRLAKFRTYDGHCNNLANPKWGATMQPVARFLNPLYADGTSLPRMYSRVKDRNTGRYPLLPTPRYVSRQMLLPDDGDDKHLPDISNLFMQWGQFTDHDMTGTPVSKATNGKDLKCCNNVFLSDDNPHHPDVFQGKPCFPIYIPPGDRHFDRTCMNFARSQPEPRKLMCEGGIREQMNMITAFIDASQVYGSSFKEMRDLRTYNLGQLKVTEKNLLPEDVNATCIKDNLDDYCFKAGDERVNEQPALTALHTAFHRYHNMLTLTLKRINSHWEDERLYREGRKILGGLLQHVTYYEWLPILLGRTYMKEYGLTVSGSADYQPYGSNNWYYDSSMNPTIMNAFATAAFRFGHSLVPSKFSMGGRRELLRNMFNRPKFILQNDGEGMNLICNGLAGDPLQHPDHFFATDLTDRLFEDFNNKSLDLTSLNIQRGRDHGLPPYNDFRRACGIPALQDYSALKINFPDKAKLLSQAYRNIDDLDLFPGGISENPVAGGMVGPTFACIIAEQFRRIKYGDRYWYETQDRYTGFTLDQVKEIKKFSIARILCDATSAQEMQTNAFLQPSYLNPRIPCRDLPDLDYNKWKE